MGLRDMYSAGDIIEYEGGGRDYLVSIEGEEGLWVNASSNTETYISRDGEGRAYTQARASEWVPFFMMDMWIPVLLPIYYCGLLQYY